MVFYSYVYLLLYTSSHKEILYSWIISFLMKLSFPLAEFFLLQVVFCENNVCCYTCVVFPLPIIVCFYVIKYFLTFLTYIKKLVRYITIEVRKIMWTFIKLVCCPSSIVYSTSSSPYYQNYKCERDIEIHILLHRYICVNMTGHWEDSASYHVLKS